MMDNNGQATIEYLLIFFISIIIISTIIIPFTLDEIDTINDIKNTIQTKSMLDELSANVNMVYSSDYGTQKNIAIKAPMKMNLSYKQNGSRHYIYTYQTYHDNTKKWVGVEVPCKISFANKPNYSYTSLKNNWWYYNTEVKWLKDNNENTSVNIYFK